MSSQLNNICVTSNLSLLPIILHYYPKDVFDTKMRLKTQYKTHNASVASYYTTLSASVPSKMLPNDWTVQLFQLTNTGTHTRSNISCMIYLNVVLYFFSRDNKYFVQIDCFLFNLKSLHFKTEDF